MLGEISIQVKFIVFALALAILSPFFIFFIPLAYFETIYIHIESWLMLIPMRNFILLGLGFLGLVIILVLLAWKRRRVTYVLGAVLLLCSLFLFFQSQRNYIAFQDSGIEMLVYGNAENYYWEDMKSIVYESSYHDGSYYTFHMKDGYAFDIAENGQLKDARGRLLAALRKYEIPYTDNYRD